MKDEEMPDLEVIRARMEGMKLKQIARETGLSYGTVYAFYKGDGRAPMYDTARRIWNHLIERANG